MKRVHLSLDDIAGYDNLCRASAAAAKGKRTRQSVSRFFREFDSSVNRLAKAILSGAAPCGRYRRFVIRDPKKRIIHAASFEDRVLHHAVMNLAGPVLDRAMIQGTFACRKGKGTLEAVFRVRRLIQRYPWFVKIDIKGYFETIDHTLLIRMIRDKFKGDGFLDLMERIIGTFQAKPGKGLPIGSLTSQHLANYYLDGLDRFVTETLNHPYARYMDDMIWFCPTREAAVSSLGRVKQYAEDTLKLVLKPSVQINRSDHGVTYCGFRIYPGTLKPGKRQLKRYHSRRKHWEKRYRRGMITALKLQAAYAAVHSMLGHGRSLSWRKRNLERFPSPDV